MKTERNILVAFLLNLFFSVFEFIGGLFTGSVAILSDAVHDLGDSISIGLSFFLEKKSNKKPNKKYTYGYLRYSILGALITTIILIVGSIFVIVEAIKRISNPIDINYNGMIIFAVIGVVVNFIACVVTRDGESLNQRSVNLHMLEDILGWIVVLVGSIFMKFTDICIIDPIMSIGVSLFILFHSFRNLKEVLDIFLVKSPNNIDIDELENHLTKIKGIKDIHHVHVWSMDNINNYATLHVVVDECDIHEIKDIIRKECLEFNINHVTIEIEDCDEECSNDTCVIKKSNTHHHHHH